MSDARLLGQCRVTFEDGKSLIGSVVLAVDVSNTVTHIRITGRADQDVPDGVHKATEGSVAPALVVDDSASFMCTFSSHWGNVALIEPIQKS